MTTRMNEYAPLPYRVSNYVKETHDVYTFEFERKNEGRAGQFFMLSSPGIGEAPISVASGFNHNLLFTIRSIGSVTRGIEKLDTIYVRGPYGNRWPWDEFDEVLAIAGGIGVPPIRSLIEEMTDAGRSDSLEVLYGSRLPRDIVYQKEIEDWKKKIRFGLTVDRGDETWNGNVGFVTKLIKDSSVSKDGAAFVIGPPLMMKNSVTELLNQGFKEDRIFMSLERRMECGFGVCGHCNLGEYYVCEDGPILNYSSVKNQEELFL